MALNLRDKQTIVTEVKEATKSALSAVIADFCGINVVKMTELRKAGREAGIYMRVMRNTLLRFVVTGTQFECLKNELIGPTLVAFSMKNPGTAARLFRKFTKDNTKFKIKAAAFKGKLIPALQVDYLATLPTYEEAISCLMAIMKEISVGKLFLTLTAICNKKEINDA